MHEVKIRIPEANEKAIEEGQRKKIVYLFGRQKEGWRNRGTIVVQTK